MRSLHFHVCRFAVLSSAMVLVLACRGTGRLDEYDFVDRTLAARSLVPPHPEVLTGPWFFHWSHDPLQNVIRTGTRVAREVEAARIRERLDSAVVLVDVADRLAARAYDRAAFHLRAEPTDDDRSADFVMEIVVKEYGIDAEDWEAAAHFYVKARLTLIDGRSGQQIWDTDVTARDRIAPAVFGSGVIRDIVTARALANQSVEEIARTLERLADYCGDRITERLRDALDRVQRGDSP